MTAPADRRPLRAARPAAAAAGCVMAVAAGVGWLYLLRDSAVLAVGPRVGGALPLQQLAGGAGQPLLRLAVAFLPAGVLAGAALTRAGVLGRAARAAAAAAVAFAIVWLTAALSDAVTANLPLGSQLIEALRHGAVWVATALVAAGALAGWPGTRWSGTEAGRHAP